MTPKNVIITIGATAAALTAIATAWITFGGAIPATQLYVTQSDDAIKKEMTRGFQRVEADGKKHSLESSKWGRKIYNQELRGLLIIPPPTDQEQHQYWKEGIERAKRERKFYIDKEIELRKK